MRDPWIPIAMLLIVVVTVWLGILGPLPAGVGSWLQGWQTLLAAGVASIAAVIAFRNTSRSLEHAASLEHHRRSRKHAALRALLPLALSELSDYAERTARALEQLISKCVGESLTAKEAPENLAVLRPSEAIELLADFIEYSDSLDVSVLERTVAWIQIYDARLRGVVRDNRDTRTSRRVVRSELEERIIEAASIYAGAASAFEYARRREAMLPTTISWDDVKRALRNMGFFEDEFPRLHEALDRHRRISTGPFDSLSPGWDILDKKLSDAV